MTFSPENVAVDSNDIYCPSLLSHGKESLKENLAKIPTLMVSSKNFNFIMGAMKKVHYIKTVIHASWVSQSILFIVKYPEQLEFPKHEFEGSLHKSNTLLK